MAGRPRPPAEAFSALSRANRHGFTLTGTGDATVRTPAFYAPGAKVEVTESGPGFDTTSRLRPTGADASASRCPVDGTRRQATIDGRRFAFA